MPRKSSVVLALALMGMGCTKPDPTNARLQAGALAVVVGDEAVPIAEADAGVRVLEGSPLTRLESGTTVRVGDDPGGTPGKPSRMVRVVVENGVHRGAAGKMSRAHLMPAP